MRIKTGYPLRIVDVKGIEESGLTVGQKGWANSVVNIEGKEYVFLLPEGQKEMFVMISTRLEVDEEALAAGADLTQDTLGKVQ